MYNPPSTDPLLDNTVDEFIELVNISGQEVPLYDPAYPTNLWRLQGGVTFSFPANTAILVGGVVLVVSFDPADSTALAAFRSKYSIASSVPVYGPYVGKLRNSGDEVELYRPDAPQAPGRPDAGYVPFLRVDKVNYSDVDPWPTQADGTGMSLQRRDRLAFGNDPANWLAGSPTPGVGGGSSTEIVLAIEASGPAAPKQIQFNSVSGQTYAVQFKNDLQSTVQWQSLTNVTASGSTVVVEDPTSPSATQRFYIVMSP
jgi:hypothetical protein